MKRVLVLISSIIALVMSASTIGIVRAQANGYSANFVTSITYQNVGSGPANMTWTFYPSSGSPIPYNPPSPLNANASTSLHVGNQVSGFSGTGSAVVSSDQPLVSTIVQLPQPPTGPVRNRPLSNGFGPADSSNTVLIATVLKNAFNQTTKFSVQNADTSPITATIKFFAVGATTPTHTIPNIPINVGAAYFVDAGTIGALGSSFNGSATVEASGKVVATALELSTVNYLVRAFEGVAQGATKIYMPSALCRFGGQNQFTSYAVQNASLTNSATVRITYSNGTVTPVQSISAGGKWSFNTCTDLGNPLNFNGSAIVESTNGVPIVVIGKVGTNPPSNFGTAFVGVSSGARRLAAPYVRWTPSLDPSQPGRQQSNIAIQNVGNVASGTITVKYYDNAGALIATHTLSSLAPGAKTNSSPGAYPSDPNMVLASSVPPIAIQEFGYRNASGGSAVGGGVIIECANSGCQIAATVRVASPDTPSGRVAEDYNAIPIN